jgi:hypothetical protein
MTAKFNTASGKALEIQSFKVVLGNIDKFVKSAAEQSLDLHNIMVQCALHVWDNGDLSLCKRLCDELADKSGYNVQGVLKWFGDAIPATGGIGKNWKLMDVTGQTYASYVKRMSEMSTPAEKDEPDPKKRVAQPDPTMGPGNRMFFIGWCADHPFWTDDVVRQAQRQTIRVLGLKQVLGFAYAIKTQYQKAVSDGRFPEESKKAAEAFIAMIQEQTAKFEKDHAADILAGEREAADLKQKLEAGEVVEAKQEAQEGGAPQPAVDAVGGDVTEGISPDTGEDVEVPAPPATGTEG